MVLPGTVRGNHLKSNGGTLADGADANIGRRSGQRKISTPQRNTGCTGLTLLSGFEGIDGGEARMPEDFVVAAVLVLRGERPAPLRAPPVFDDGGEDGDGQLISLCGEHVNYLHGHGIH